MEELTNKELTKALLELSKSQVKQVDVLKDFVIQNIKSHENHLKNTNSLIDYNEINNYNLKKIISYISIILYLIIMIISYLLNPIILNVLKTTSQSYANLSEGWQIAIFGIIGTLIAGTIATVMGMIIYDKIKSKN